MVADAVIAVLLKVCPALSCDRPRLADHDLRFVRKHPELLPQLYQADSVTRWEPSRSPWGQRGYTNLEEVPVAYEFAFNSTPLHTRLGREA